MIQYPPYEDSGERLWFLFTAKKIEQAIKRKQWAKARESSFEWAQGVCEQLGLDKADHWKFFKRSVVAKWFGHLENKRFQPGWSVDKVLQYAKCFSGCSVRFSLFPKDIAVHAQSVRLPANQKDQWEHILAQADHSVAIEIFPETSNGHTICFRRYTDQFGGTIFYEASTGQAMFAFEFEQGQHPFVIAIKSGPAEYIYQKIMPESCHPAKLEEIEFKLKNLIQKHENTLNSKCLGMCRMLGIDYVAIEGYYNPEKPDKLSIVDMDLPFDVAFMVS